MSTLTHVPLALTNCERITCCTPKSGCHDDAPQYTARSIYLEGDLEKSFFGYGQKDRGMAFEVNIFAKVGTELGTFSGFHWIFQG